MSSFAPPHELIAGVHGFQNFLFAFAFKSLDHRLRFSVPQTPLPRTLLTQHSANYNGAEFHTTLPIFPRPSRKILLRSSGVATGPSGLTGSTLLRGGEEYALVCIWSSHLP